MAGHQSNRRVRRVAAVDGRCRRHRDEVDWNGGQHQLDEEDRQIDELCSARKLRHRNLRRAESRHLRVADRCHRVTKTRQRKDHSREDEDDDDGSRR